MRSLFDVDLSQGGDGKSASRRSLELDKTKSGRSSALGAKQKTSRQGGLLFNLTEGSLRYR